MTVSSCFLCSPFAEGNTLAYFPPSSPPNIFITLLYLNKIRQGILRGWRETEKVGGLG